MKNILKYKQFENKWKIDLTEDESELKDNLEFIFLELKDLSTHYEISGRNIYMIPNTIDPNSRWYQYTGVEIGFKHYLNIRINPNYNEIEEVINVIKDSFNYITNDGWKYSVTIERGATIIGIDINSIVELYKYNKNLGAISVFLWKI
jgi:hypothetical protein